MEEEGREEEERETDQERSLCTAAAVPGELS
jgi:hypothetical protein